MGQRLALLLLALITYSQNVAPLLSLRCVECHASGSNLDLSRFPFPYDSAYDQSAIVQKILTKVDTAKPQMPPGNRPKLTQSQIGTLQQWLAGGLAP